MSGAAGLATRALAAFVVASFGFVSGGARAAPSASCPGACAVDGGACGGANDCAAGACVFVDACLPGLAHLVAGVVPEGPRGLNDATSWTCGLLDCAVVDGALAFHSDLGQGPSATKDIALEAGKRYLARASMRADAGTWGRFDVVMGEVVVASTPVVAREWTEASAFIVVPATHVGPVRVRLHADGPGQVGIRDVVVLELSDYALALRLSAPDAVGPVRFELAAGLAVDARAIGMTLAAEGAGPTRWVDVATELSGAARATLGWRLAGDAAGARVRVELATSPLSIIWAASRTVVGARFGVVVPGGVPSPDALVHVPALAAELVARDLPFADRATAPPSHAPYHVGARVGSLAPFEDAPEASTALLDVYGALGLDVAATLAAAPSAAEQAHAEALGLAARIVRIAPFSDGEDAREGDALDLDPAAITAAVARRIDAAPGWAVELARAAPSEVRLVVLDGAPPRLAGPACDTAYRAWLADEGVTAESLGLGALDDASSDPGARPDPSDAPAARRWTYARRFIHEAAARAYGVARDALVVRFGPLTLVGRAPSPRANDDTADDTAARFQALARAGVVRGALGDATLDDEDDCRAWEVGLAADHLAGVTAPWREAAASAGSPFVLAASLSAGRGDVGAKLVELAARGVTWFEHDAYGPRDLVAPARAMTAAGGLGPATAPWLERVRAGNGTLAAAAPLIAGARAGPAGIVMLASESDGAWSDAPTVTAEERGWHLALTQAHHAVDVMLESEVAAGLLASPLASRRVLIVARRHLSSAAFAAIVRWVEDGGTVVFAGAHATHDEHGQFVLAREDWRLYFARDEAPIPAGTIRWASARGTASFAYAGPRAELVTLAASPLAVDDDDRAVALRIARGRGRIIALGARLGEAYAAPVASCDRARPPALGQRPSGFSSVMREVMSEVVTDAGARPAAVADAPQVALHRLDAAGSPRLVALPYGNGAVSIALSLPEASGCTSIREAIGDADVPLAFGTALVTIDAPAILTWDPVACAPPATAEPSPEVAEPSPPRPDEGCDAGVGTGTGTSAALAVLAAWAALAWRRAREARIARARIRAR